MEEILTWAECHVPALTIVHIPGVANCQAKFLSCQCLVEGEMVPSPRGFEFPLSQVGVAGCGPVRLTVQQQTEQVHRQVRDPGAFAVDTLVTAWDRFCLIYAFI